MERGEPFVPPVYKPSAALSADSAKSVQKLAGQIEKELSIPEQFPSNHMLNAVLSEVDLSCFMLNRRCHYKKWKLANYMRLCLAWYELNNYLLG